MKTSNKNRHYLINRYGPLYKRAMWVTMHECVYCSSPRECIDHVPALIALEGINVKNYLKKGGTLLLYPSCIKCNNLLGRCEFTTLYDRLNYLLPKYLNRLDKIEVWSDDDLSEMGKNMRSYIEAQQHKLSELNNKVFKIDEKILQIESGKMLDDGMLVD